jgi:hypothetical protein
MKIDLKDKVVWQQACGDRNRDYSAICIKYSVILNGPGGYGKWPECKVAIGEDRSSRKITDLWRFCEEIKSGDIIVLKIGINTVYAVGEVVGGYFWDDNFGDIDGWDLEHIRRVRWLWHDLAHPKIFKVKWGDTTQKLIRSGEVWEWLNSLEIPELNFTQDLTMLPLNWNSDTNIQEVAEHLYSKGVSGNSVNHLLSEFDELVRIAKWYIQSESLPSESETIAYLVMPLLRALGWSPQRMAIEWNRVDVALFDSLPRNDANLDVVVECKQMHSSCLTALSQAEEYAKNRENCRRLIVSDGIRYGVFIKNDHVFELKAYLNLSRLRSQYFVYEASGIQEGFYIMSPEFKLK